jgi:hypothetical protein
VNPDLIAELVFGVYCAEEPIRTEDAPETASGVVNIVPDLPRDPVFPDGGARCARHRFRYPQPGTRGMVHDPVTITVTHPPFPDSGIEVERWTTRLGWESFNLTGFSFDVPEELVLGTWTFEHMPEARSCFT